VLKDLLCSRLQSSVYKKKPTGCHQFVVQVKIFKDKTVFWTFDKNK